jgi:hypothetical protein
MGGKINEKSQNEIRVFSNVFLRTMAENLTCESQELKNFLYNIIQEEVDDPYIQTSICIIMTINSRLGPSEHYATKSDYLGEETTAYVQG